MQKIFGLLFGIVFGFLLQKGGVGKYEIIVKQLLFEDFTVVKIMLTAILVGTIGITIMHTLGKVKLSIKPGSIGQVAVGGIIFGLGFGLLGSCPGTLFAALGEARLDAGIFGILGIILGSWLYALAFPKLNKTVLKWGYFGDKTLPQLLKVHPVVIALPMMVAISAILYFLYLNA